MWENSLLERAKLLDRKKGLRRVGMDNIDHLLELLAHHHRVHQHDRPGRGDEMGRQRRSVDAGDRFQVKRIMVAPGAQLSLQSHFHRAEHWIVVQGTLEVTIDNQMQLLNENQSTYIPLGVNHRLENPGKIPLEIIEVQSGSYLGEDDIVRFDDNYGRS